MNCRNCKYISFDLYSISKKAYCKFYKKHIKIKVKIENNNIKFIYANKLPKICVFNRFQPNSIRAKIEIAFYEFISGYFFTSFLPKKLFLTKNTYEKLLKETNQKTLNQYKKMHIKIILKDARQYNPTSESDSIFVLE